MNTQIAITYIPFDTEDEALLFEGKVIAVQGSSLQDSLRKSRVQGGVEPGLLPC